VGFLDADTALSHGSYEAALRAAGAVCAASDLPEDIADTLRTLLAACATQAAANAAVDEDLQAHVCPVLDALEARGVAFMRGVREALVAQAAQLRDAGVNLAAYYGELAAAVTAHREGHAVVDAAVGLVQKGHEVVMYTSHHDPGHSFPETHDGTLTVKVYGDFLPRSILGKGHILCATVRGIYLALMLLLREKAWDVMIVDQLSVPVPILLLSGARIIFYCHFPDLKLAAKGGVLKALYRMPFDYLEETTTLLAHKILVNSKFTMGVFLETFPSAKEPPEVLYPSINLGHYEPAPSRS
jgi:hypothetical protein